MGGRARSRGSDGTAESASRSSTAGYSGRPLAAKLGLKPDMVVHVRGRSKPADWAQLVGGLPDGVTLRARRPAHADLVHLFTTDRAELEREVPALRDVIAPDGMLWVSWPKKSSGVASTVTEDVVRAVALTGDLVDVKVCAVDEVWSGLKLVIRRERR